MKVLIILNYRPDLMFAYISSTQDSGSTQLIFNSKFKGAILTSLLSAIVSRLYYCPLSVDLVNNAALHIPVTRLVSKTIAPQELFACRVWP
jgi:hypothetical protein